MVVGKKEKSLVPNTPWCSNSCHLSKGFSEGPKAGAGLLCGCKSKPVDNFCRRVIETILMTIAGKQYFKSCFYAFGIKEGT